MKKNEVLKKYQHYFFIFFDLFLNIFNYFFHIFIAWYIIPHEYGLLNSLLSIASILFVVGISLQLFVSKSIANKMNKISLLDISSFSLVTLPIITIILLFFMPYLQILTNSNKVSIFLLILIYFINTYLCLLRGIFQGDNKFLYINISMYIEVFTKMILLILFLPIYKNIYVVLISIFLGMVSSLIFSIMKNKNKFNQFKLDFSKYWIIGKELSIIIFSNVFLYFFTAFDMIYTNKFLSEFSGVYAVILRLAQLITFAYSSLFVLLNPWISDKVNDIKRLKISLKKYSFLFIVLNIFILTVYYYLVPKLIPFLFGYNYRVASNFVGLESIAYILLAMSFFLVNLCIQLTSKGHLLILSCSCILLGTSFFIYGKTIENIIKAQIFSYFFMFITLLIYVIFRLKEEKNG
ncbi:MAG: oligosaccharide flippase family protein [Leptotrichiaceae bacterium]|nr:oligosaccharide flippase family protein [Leptotrichiaceae bacterium]